MRIKVTWLAALVAVLAVTLLVPATTEAAPAQWNSCTQWHTVGWGENLYRISLYYGTTVGRLQALNGIANPNYVRYGQALCVRGGASFPYGHHGFSYTVRYGDTLYGIGQRFGVSVWSLATITTFRIPTGSMQVRSYGFPDRPRPAAHDTPRAAGHAPFQGA